jgi:ATPase subunit of ABC transporter with duplicated ATPase domains
MLDKLQVDDIKPSSRKYPYIAFKPEREAGDQLLAVEKLSAMTDDGTYLFKDISFSINKNDKIAFFDRNGGLAVTALFDILMNERKSPTGDYRWGVTTTQSYLPNDNTQYFEGNDDNLVDWLRPYSVDKDETFVWEECCFRARRLSKKQRCFLEEKNNVVCLVE